MNSLDVEAIPTNRVLTFTLQFLHKIRKIDGEYNRI